jgi:hypothetical protein
LAFSGILSIGSVPTFTGMDLIVHRFKREKLLGICEGAHGGSPDVVDQALRHHHL